MKKIKNLMISSILLLSTWNCTERIDVSVDTTYTRLVVEGYLTTDTLAHHVRLSTSSDYFYNHPAPAVSNAIVEISYGDTVIVLKESAEKPGFYFTDPDFYGIPGEVYSLTIGNVDIDKDGTMEEYSARSELRPVNSIDSIQLEYVNTFFSGWMVRIYAWDSPEEDFYSFKVHRNGVLMTDTLLEMIVQDDIFFNGSYTNGITSQFLSESKEEEKLLPGDTVTFEINGITEEYFHYIMEAQSQVYPQTPLFSGPPANIGTNLSNGAVGFFVAYSVEYCSTVWKGQDQ